MVTGNEYIYNEIYYGSVVICGLSTDTKPTNYGNGSIFVEIDTGNVYRFNTVAETWVKSTNEVDTKISALETSVETLETNVGTISETLTKYNPFGGWVESNTDLNDIITYGAYLVSSDRTYTNAPVESIWGLLIVIKDTSTKTSPIFQLILSSVGKIYYRNKTSNGWTNWYSYTGTIIST